MQAEPLRRAMTKLPDLQALYHYPHPLTGNGVVIVAHSAPRQWEQFLSTAYQYKPAAWSIHCLRAHELSHLSGPGIFAPPLQINELPHLLPCLQQKGTTLWGEDLRQSIPPSSYPRPALLHAHLEGCQDTMRRYAILPMMVEAQYASLIGIIEREMRYLMTTALLLHEVWDIEISAVPPLFHQHFPHQTAAWSAWEAVQSIAKQRADKNSAVCAIWQFEQFMRALDRIAACN
jgi:hypothetical protein